MTAPEPTRRRILLVEACGARSTDLTEALADSGFDVDGPYAKSAEALAALQTARIDAACLRFRRDDAECAGLIRTLRDADVPTLLLSETSKPLGNVPAGLTEHHSAESPRKVMALLKALLERRGGGYSLIG